MASVKIKFRHSTSSLNEGHLFYQVIHNRRVRQIKTSYRLYDYEWDNESQAIVFSKTERFPLLCVINDDISRDLRRLNDIIAELYDNNRPFLTDDIVDKFKSKSDEVGFLNFMEDIIVRLKNIGKVRTSETYASSLNSFKRFILTSIYKGNNSVSMNITLDEINTNTIQAYESYLKEAGLSPNSSSFYMRNLRAVYNRAVESNLTVQCYPFKHVYTGVEKTAKRAIPLKTMKYIKDMDLAMWPTLEFARDMFMFSFYTRGMSFVDMAYLRKSDLKNGILTYRRRKTGQQLYIRWEKCMQEIVAKYCIKNSVYLLSIINSVNTEDERRQYIYASHAVNRGLKAIGRKIGLTQPLTMYVARHAWASIARSRNVPISVISEGMGHDSESTTRIYLASLDSVAVDKANSMILKLL